MNNYILHFPIVTLSHPDRLLDRCRTLERPVSLLSPTIQHISSFLTGRMNHGVSSFMSNRCFFIAFKVFLILTDPVVFPASTRGAIPVEVAESRYEILSTGHQYAPNLYSATWVDRHVRNAQTRIECAKDMRSR